MELTTAKNLILGALTKTEIKQLQNAAAKQPGATPGAVAAAYGPRRVAPSGNGMMWPDNSWESKNVVAIPTNQLGGFPPYPMPDGRFVVPRVMRLHYKLELPLRLTWKVLVAANAQGNLRTFNGCLTNRFKLFNPANPPSIHAFAAAIDWNAATASWNVPIGKLSKPFIQAIEIFEACGWAAGIRWRPADGMHVQWTQPEPGTNLLLPAHYNAVAKI